LDRTTPEARLVQGLIYLAAACVKIREVRVESVIRHAESVRELLGELGAAIFGDADREGSALGLASDSILGVL
jgi:hypothetical protein